MKIKVTEQKTHELEISIPSYWESTIAVYKIISEEKCVKVNHIKGMYEVSINHAELPFQADEPPKLITEEKFNTEFNKVVYELTNLIK